MKLRTKILLAFLLVGIVPMLVAGGRSLMQTTTTLQSMAYNQMRAARESKKARLLKEFDLLASNMETLTRNEQMMDFFRRVENYFDRYVVVDQPIDTASDYNLKELILEEEKADIVKNLVQSQGYDDFYVIWPQTGHILVTMPRPAQEDQPAAEGEEAPLPFGSDTGLRLADAKHKKNQLATVWQQVVKTKKPAFVDFQIYQHAGDRPVAFYGVPFRKDDSLAAVLVVRLKPDRLDAIMSETAGLGETGQTYLVGRDLLPRSSIRTDASQTRADATYRTIAEAFAKPESARIDTAAVRHVFEQHANGDGVEENYLGRKVIASYAPVEIAGVEWALVAEIAEAEALGPLQEMTRSIGLTLIASVVVVVLIAIWFVGVIARPVQRGAELAKSIRAGDLEQRLKVKSRDEIGELTSALNDMAETLKRLIGEMLAVSEGAAQGDLTRRIEGTYQGEYDSIKRALNTIVESNVGMVRTIQRNARAVTHNTGEIAEITQESLQFSERMSNDANNVASASEEMSQSINSTAAAAEELSVNISSISSASEQLSINMKAVATAVEQMTDSIKNIDQNARQGAEFAARADEVARTTSDGMQVLGQAACEITNVTEMIKRIAQQTNLLALNATIEAASAGEAGKGFAVVANEIKELANQSAHAAEDIAEKIEGMQKSAEEAVKAIGDISEVIDTLNKTSGIIYDAVAQQTNSAKDIALNIGEATKGVDSIAATISDAASGANDISSSTGEIAAATKDIAEHILEVSGATRHNSENAKRIDSQTRELSQVAEKLRQMVNRFKLDEEAAAAGKRGRKEPRRNAPATEDVAV